MKLFLSHIFRAGRQYRLRRLIRNLRPHHPNAPLMRLGGDGDGGYLLPNDLVDIDAVFSPGVEAKSQFEAECQLKGLAAHLADASADSPACALPGEWTFEKKFVGPTTEGQYISMTDWIQEKCPGDGKLLLQMDIEGSEYDTILAMNDELMCRFKYMVIEFHDLHSLWTLRKSRKIFQTLNKILITHSVVHLHPNNCCPVLHRHGIDLPRVLEITFAHKNLVNNLKFAHLPSPLDQKNVPNKPAISLSNLWYKP